MGQDYLARKASKKRSKKEGRNNDEGAAKRERQKRATPRKRQGVCFGQPVLAPADRYASDDEMQLDTSEYDVLAGASIRAPLPYAIAYEAQCPLSKVQTAGCTWARTSG